MFVMILVITQAAGIRQCRARCTGSAHTVRSRHRCQRQGLGHNYVGHTYIPFEFVIGVNGKVGSIVTRQPRQSMCAHERVRSCAWGNTSRFGCDRQRQRRIKLETSFEGEDGSCSEALQLGCLISRVQGLWVSVKLVSVETGLATARYG